VRELRIAVERALILSDGRPITPEHLPATPGSPRDTALSESPREAVSPAAVAPEFPSQGVDLEGKERELVEQALRHAGQNKAKAARLLGLTRTKLYTRMQRFGLS
jgi:DNA-binding NtrC family response regulator